MMHHVVNKRVEQRKILVGAWCENLGKHSSLQTTRLHFHASYKIFLLSLLLSRHIHIILQHLYNTESDSTQHFENIYLSHNHLKKKLNVFWTVFVELL